MHRMISRSCLALLSATLLVPVPQAAAGAEAVRQTAIPAPSHSAPPAPDSAPAADPAVSGPAAVLTGAEAKLSKEAAIAIAARLGEVPADYQLVHSSLNTPDHWRTFPVWSFTWQKTSEDQGQTHSLSVSVDANTGELTGYYRHDGEQGDTPADPAITRDKALQIAEQFLSERAPSRAKAVRLYDRDQPPFKPPLNRHIFYPFRFVQEVDGIVFPTNTIHITVGGDGQVRSFDLNWNDRVRLEKPVKPITPEQARERFAKGSTATLSYFIPWQKREHGKSTQANLVYPNPFSFYLDAESGKILPHPESPNRIDVTPRPASPQPLSPLHRGKPLEQAQAVALAKRLFDLDGYQLGGSTYREGTGGRPVWDLTFEKKGDARPHAFVTVDAVTGDVLAYSRDAHYAALAGKPVEPSAPWPQEKLTEKALETVRRLMPTMASDLYLTDIDQETIAGTAIRQHFRFQRHVNGIPVAKQPSVVTLDARNGEVVYLSLDRGAETFPSKPATLKTAEEAMQAWLEEAEVELMYHLPFPREGDNGTAPPVARAVYRVIATPAGQPYVFDAVTGQWLGETSGKPIVLHRPKPLDITGHPAERELMLMYEYDALALEDGKILPDKPVTRGEMIHMLVLALNGGTFYPEPWLARNRATFADVGLSHPYFAAIEAAAANGLLDTSGTTLEPDAEIHRDELADLLTRALGYGKLAKHSQLFSSNLTDISGSKHAGAIAIVTTLGIMPAKDNAFRPEATVSRADAAVAFARFLEKRRELDETRPFRY